MRDEEKTKEQFISQVEKMRRRNDELAQEDITERKRVGKEHERRLCLEQVHRMVLDMGSRDDFGMMVNTLADKLRSLEIEFDVIGLNVFDEEAGTLSAWDIAPEGVMVRATTSLDHPSNQKLLEYWRRNECWVRAPDSDFMDINERLQRQARGAFDSYVPAVVVDTPFAQGTLVITSEQPVEYDSEDIQTLRDFCDILSVGFRRLEDITERRRAEEALRRRAALDKVRVSAYEMKETADIQKVLTSLYEALQDIGVEFDHCSVQTVDEERGLFRIAWQVYDKLHYIGPGHELAMELPLAGSAMYEAWQDKRVVYRRDLAEEDPYRERTSIREAYDKDIRSVVDVPFFHGTVAMNSVQPEALSEADIEVLKQFAGVLSEAYTRVEDIRRMEESATALRESEERYRTLFGGIGDGILVHDEEGVILDANEVTCTRLGRTLAELKGMNIRELVTEENAARVVNHVQKTITEGTDTFETQFVSKSGKVVFCEVLEHTIEYAGQRVILSVARDITERKEMEERIQMHERLAAAGQLAAGIAHDFNNLLTGIIGFAELLQLRADMPGSAKADLQRIVGGGQRGARLIRQVLDFGRQSALQREPLDMRPFLKESIKFLQRTIPENIRVVLEIGSEVYPVNADPAQMQQIFTNLAVNARDAMPRGGELRIGLSRLMLDSEERLPFPMMSPGEWIVLSVSDTGVGILPEHLPRIYEPFFTTKERGEGTGLGLSQVYGIVKQHDGFIDVESGVGSGTTFFVYLPELETLDTGREVATEERPPGGTETVLLVEDEAGVLDVGQEMLESFGYAVLTASDGEEALSVYRAHREEIALVLMDMVMPGMGGMELYGALKQMSPEVKAVGFSGYDMQESEVREFGFKAFFRKPFQYSELARVVRETLDE